MLAFLARAPGEEVVRVITPALSTLGKSAIGAVLIVSWVLTIVAIWQLIRVQNARVADQKASTKTNAELTTKMTEAFSGMNATLNTLVDAEKTGQMLMQSMKNSLDLLLISRTK